MVCLECGDGPVDPTNDSKKKGSTVKDNEKSKRMKGESSHAIWKSEMEMHLRQGDRSSSSKIIETVITAAGRHLVGFPEGPKVTYWLPEHQVT
ncbi:hypothetical protein D8674_025968 [Pyrus ussuriensis x Pyrus communis]|uniref:Uncharacterized protein n=1 Tax=Pyrus ussuriensis x Pyrus communis TaxID=2448454 RepID=A0A5N5IJS2_9ROSA|nr:hypothetical protein D8674_025968 [Pyrus ussuriensis x Pyrus communis]